MNRVQQKPAVSVIIRTYNERRHLPGLIARVRSQTLRDAEIVVVDSGSTDGTRDLARRLADRLVCIEPHDFTFGYSLNAGIRASQGRYLVIASAHTEPLDDHWLEHLVRPLNNERTAMVYGRQLGAPTSKFSEIRDFERVFGPHPRVIRPPYFYANNANSAIRRDLWEVHPFDETLPGLEDIEWAKYWMEQGYHVVYEPRAALYHIHEETWPQVRRRYYREAVAARWIGVKHPRRIPLEFLRETGYLLADLFHAGKQKRIHREFRSIVRFRWNKAVGTARGLLDGAIMEDPRRRQAMFYDKTGRAVVIHGPGQARLEQRAIPDIRPGEVLIRVAYTGVCGTDLEIFHGTLGYYKTGMAHYPIVPGHEFSGRVVRVGANVQHVREGDPVVAECIQSCGRCDACRKKNWIACDERRELGVIGLDGAYADYVVVPGRFVHRLPTDLDLRKACLVEPLAVVLKGLKRLERALDRDGPHRVAVVGAGPIGHLTARLLHRKGHQVTVFDRAERRRSYFNGTAIATEGALRDLERFEALVEATGDPEALYTILHDSGPGAVILLLGLPYSRQEFNFEGIVAYDKIVIGSVGSSAAEFREAIAILPELDLDLFFQGIFPLASFRDAWASFQRRAYLKILLEVGGSLDS